MSIRFVSKNIHALLDYPVAAMLLAAPFVLGLGDSSPAARWLSVGTGVAALVLTLLTDHKLGVIRVIPYPVHVLVDGLVGITFLVAPFVLDFAGLDAWYYWANGAAVMTVVALNTPSGARSPAVA